MAIVRAKPGDFFKRYVQDLVIYGYAMTKEEFLESERVLGASAEELEFQSKAFDRWTMRGLLFGKCFSEACVDGEYGSTPVQTTIRIDRAEIERARSNGWNTPG